MCCRYPGRTRSWGFGTLWFVRCFPDYFPQKFFFEATDECSSPALPHSVQPVATGSAACSSRERRAGDAGSSRHFTAWPGCYHHDRVAGRKAFRALTVRLTGDKRCSLVV